MKKARRPYMSSRRQRGTRSCCHCGFQISEVQLYSAMSRHEWQFTNEHLGNSGIFIEETITMLKTFACIWLMRDVGQMQLCWLTWLHTAVWQYFRRLHWEIHHKLVISVIDWLLKKIKAEYSSSWESISELRRLQVTLLNWTHPTLTPVSQAGTRFTYPRGMEGWVDLGSLIAARLGIKPTTAWSQVRRPNRYATKRLLVELCDLCMTEMWVDVLDDGNDDDNDGDE